MKIGEVKMQVLKIGEKTKVSYWIDIDESTGQDMAMPVAMSTSLSVIKMELSIYMVSLVAFLITDGGKIMQGNAVWVIWQNPQSLKVFCKPSTTVSNISLSTSDLTSLSKIFAESITAVDFLIQKNAPAMVNGDFSIIAKVLSLL